MKRFHVRRCFSIIGLSTIISVIYGISITVAYPSAFVVLLQVFPQSIGKKETKNEIICSGFFPASETSI